MDQQELIETARSNVALRYPENMGSLLDGHEPWHCIPREAILRGDWDGGDLVQEELSRLRLRALPEDCTE